MHPGQCLCRTTIQALPPDPVAVALDQVLTDQVCAPTPTPHVTPPSTDVALARPGRASGAGLLVVLGLLSILGGASLAVARRRR